MERTQQVERNLHDLGDVEYLECSNMSHARGQAGLCPCCLENAMDLLQAFPHSPKNDIVTHASGSAKEVTSSGLVG